MNELEKCTHEIFLTMYTRPDIDEAFDGIELAISESFGVDI